MILSAIVSISVGSIAGGLLRWGLMAMLNSIFPTIPLGTLAANLISGFLIGIFMTMIKDHAYIPEVIRLGIATGFLGGLSTFSTFSAETITLLANEAYFWASVMILGHVGGTLLATIFGIYVFKFMTF